MSLPARCAVTFLLIAAAWPAAASAQGGTGGAGLRPDGTLVVAQTIEATEGSFHDQATLIAAVRPDGTLDPEYGRLGTVRGPYAHVSNVAVLPDGSAQIITERVKSCGAESCEVDHDLQRFTADGAPAGSTRVGGNSDTAAESFVHRVVPSGDGVLLRTGGNRIASVQRRAAGGQLLGSAEIGSEELFAGERIAPTPNGGALIVEGDALVRLDAALEPVPGFGENGRAPLPWARAWEDTVPVADGTSQLVLNDRASELLRLRADGSPDPDFGDGGIVSLPEELTFATALVVQPDGGILVGGAGELDSFVVARFLPSGELDPDFGEAGVAEVDFVGDYEQLTDLVLLPGGGIAAVGTSNDDNDDANSHPTRRLAVARFTSAGDLAAKALPYVDVVAPAVSFDEAPAFGSTVDHRAIRAAASSPEAGATVDCALNNGPRVPCDEPVVFEDAPAGPSHLRATVTDAAGNLRSEFRYFQVAPETRITAGPADGAGSSATFAWESVTRPTPSLQDREFFECRLDGGAWVTCASPREVAGLADGPHVFEVRQRTVSGVVEPEPARWAWRVGPEPKGDPGPGPGTGGGAPLAPPVVVPPTVEQRRAAAAAGLRVVASGPKRRARRVVLRVASAVPAAVRVTGKVKVPGRRRALAVRAFGGGVQAAGTVKATLRLGRKARALVRKRRRGTLTARVVLTGSDGVELVTRTVKVKLRG